jgi:beta-mannosidase
MSYRSLHSGWTVRAVSGPIPAAISGIAIPASVPGCVHTDLLAAGLIEDPFDGANETDQQWIGDTTWRFETAFEWTDDGAARHDLVGAGLDTIATIEVNGVVVGRTQNQHRSYRFDIGGALRGGRNTIAVEFAAPVPTAVARSIEHGPRPHANHHPYNAIRKMACNFGWDWGIDVATSGIWKAIGIESWSGVRIASVRPLVGIDGETGVLTAHVELEGAAIGDRTEITVTVAGQQETVVTDTTSGTVVLQVPEVDRWWPIGHGRQPLYEVSVSAADVASEPASREEASTWRGRVGFRTVELDVDPDDGGTPFEIRVNGATVQVRGANWIPDHAFLTDIDADRYRRRIADAIEANMNLLRVWGGGIYESEEFYARCDELGVLVWQDFLFACAAYAEEDWLATEVEAEAIQAITRLSAHPALVIWNGNNENLWGYVQWGWRPLLAGRSWGNGYYRELFPSLLAELDPTRAYSPGSPFSFTDYLHPNDENNGTMHVWDVWNGRDYTGYRAYTPRFVAEFGFQGPPAWSTLTRVVHDERLDPYGPDMLVHQKADDGNLKLERGLHGHLPVPATIEDWHFATQLNQAMAVRFGIEHFRSLAPHNTGSIVWQLNDNWPVISWAAVDFDEHRKPLWYALRSAYRPRLATIQPRDGGLALILLNDTPDRWAGRITVSRVAFDGTVLATEDVRGAAAERGALTLPLPAELSTPGRVSSEVLVADFGDAAFARAIWNFAEVVDQDLDPGPITATATRADTGYRVSVTARSYVRALTLQIDRVDPLATVDDALVTLLPGETARFRITSTVQVDPAAFLQPLVLRHANGLLSPAGPENLG